MADTVVFSGGNIFFPFHFRTAEFIPDHSTAEFTGAFRFHWKGRGIGTAGNSVLIYGIIFVFQTSTGIQRNVSFLEMSCVSICIDAKSITRKEIFIKSGVVKGGIPLKRYGDSRVDGRQKSLGERG